MVHSKTTLRFAALLSISTLSVMAGYSSATNDDHSSEISKPSQDAENKGDSKAAAENVKPADLLQSNGELVKMQNYLAGRVSVPDIKKSLKTAQGRKVDCVDINAQPALQNPALRGHKIELAPHSAPAISKADKAVVPQTFIAPLFELNGAAEKTEVTSTCPDGTVPIPEVTMDDLKRFSTLEEFFQKVPSSLRGSSQAAAVGPLKDIQPPFHMGPTSLHQYAHAYRYVTNWGAQANINVWKSYTELNSEFSLGQIWIVGGSGSGLQTLEVGTQKYHNLYGDDNAHLFIYSTRDNYNTTGCYNNTCGDFVQVSSSIYPGAILTPTSVYNGAQYEANMHWFKDMDGGSWWLNFQGQWVGYYPRNLYNAAGVLNHAAEIDFGGEIIDNRNLNLHTSTDMGSGSFPSAWWQKAAYMRLLRYNYATTTNPNTVWYTDVTGLTTSRSDAACYDISFYTGDANWGSYFFYGGPGFDYQNCR